MLKSDPTVKCVAMVDVDSNVLTQRMADLQKEFPENGEVKSYSDYKEMLADDSIDTVIIGTPDHWHCLQFVDACKAGKSIMLEKPIGNYIAEAEIMVAAAEKYNNIVCVNQHQRSNVAWNKAIEIVKSGVLGQITHVKVWGNFGYGIGRPFMSDSPVPAGVDFNTWLGPSKKRTFNNGRYHGSWRMFWDYGGGLLSDWGVHLIDMGILAMDAAGVMPNQVYANGGRFAYLDHNSETPSLMNVVYQYDNWQMTWEQNGGQEQGPYGQHYGVAYIGTNGTLVVDRDGYKAFPLKDDGKLLMEPIEPMEGAPWSGDQISVPAHALGFIKCIKAGDRKTPCTIQEGRDACVLAHVANISLRLGGVPLVYDSKTQRFVDNDQANMMLYPKYRTPYVFPTI